MRRHNYKLEILAYTADLKKAVHFEDVDAGVVLLKLLAVDPQTEREQVLMQADVTALYEADPTTLQNAVNVLDAQIEFVERRAFDHGLRKSQEAVELRRALAVFLQIPIPKGD